MSIYSDRPRPQKFCSRRRRLRTPPGNELIIFRACVCGGEVLWMPVAAIIGDFLICVYVIKGGAVLVFVLFMWTGPFMVG